MTGDDFKNVIAFENGLSVGDAVQVHWTNSGHFWLCFAIVKKINKQSFIVTLSKPCGDTLARYAVGREIKAPRLAQGSGMKLWSVNNRLEPVKGYNTLAVSVGRI